MRDDSLAGRTALVTGGAGGIGAEICRELAAAGAHVVAVDIAAERAAALVADLQAATAIGADLADADSIDALIAAVSGFAPIDILVSCAGWDRRELFVDSSPSMWDRVLSINLRSAIQLSHALLPAMMAQGWGRLVFISSDAGRVGSGGEAVYSAAKAGVIGFAKAIARESARSGVTSNVVCPGPADTQMLRDVASGSEDFVKALERAIPMRRLATPQDVAAAVSYLASPAAGYVTGQTISVSGGLTMA